MERQPSSAVGNTIKLFLDAGFELSITSNFAKRLAQDELDAMARMASSRERRHPRCGFTEEASTQVDIEVLLANMADIRNAARAKGAREPVSAGVASSATWLRATSWSSSNLGGRRRQGLHLLQSGRIPHARRAIAVRNVAALDHRDLLRFRKGSINASSLSRNREDRS